MTAEPASLNIAKVSKTYPNGLRALHEVSLEVRPGEVFGLVGPNGAGKTTLLKVAAGLLFPQAGSVTFGATDITSRPGLAAGCVGLMPDPLGVYTDVSSAEYLEFFGRTLGLSGRERESRIGKAIDLLGLGPWIDSEVETLSAGWQRRLALGRVLLADVPVLLLDEPAAGLDVSARSGLLGIVRKLAGAGKTVVISSHILPELQQLADRFGIIDRGRWVEVLKGRTFFSRRELETGFSAASWLMRCGNPALAADILRRAGMEPAADGIDGIVLNAADDRAAALALRKVIDGGVEVFEYSRRRGELTTLVLDVLSEKPGKEPAK